MSDAGQRLIRAASEAREIVEGRRQAAHMFVPADMDVRGVRRALSLSQDDFAAEFGFSTTQIRDWEQGRSRPLGAARAYLMMIEADSETVRKLLSMIKVKAAEDAAA